MGTLVIGRRSGESIFIGEHRLTVLQYGKFSFMGRTIQAGAEVFEGEIRITSKRMSRSYVRFWINAPREIKILREELLNREN